MSHLAYATLFAALVVLTILVRLTRNPESRTKVISLLIAYVIGVHLLLAAVRRDAWPFSAHGVLTDRGDAGRALSTLRFVTVDRDGREFAVPEEAWSPVTHRTLQKWMLKHYFQLPPPQQRVVAKFLVARVEDARRRQLAGERIGRRSVLGVLSAPRWYGTEGNAPDIDEPIARIRVYAVTRIPREKLRTGAEPSALVTEWHP